MSTRRATLLVVIGGAIGLLPACAAVPPPRALAEAQRALGAPKSVQARPYAPQAHARALKLLRAAEQAHQDGDDTAAASLAERATVALERAFALSRALQAEERAARAQKELGVLQADLAQIDAENAAVAAEVDALELKLRVARDAVPLEPNSPTHPEREQARLAAARALATEARLLCLGSRLLGRAEASLIETTNALDALDVQLQKHPLPAPIDRAVEHRSTCLRLLTETRRDKAAAEPQRSRAAELLQALSIAGREPQQDDRGVVVTLRNVFKRDALVDDAQKLLADLGRVAVAHPDFPVLVLVHSAQGDSTSRDRQQGERIKAELERTGAPRVTSHAVGDRLPIASPRATARNQRIEIVYVSPSG